MREDALFMQVKWPWKLFVARERYNNHIDEYMSMT